MKKILAQHFSNVLILLFILFFCLYTILIPTHYDAGDSIQHYLLAKGSWLKPELFLDLWGKPVYTIIMSGFAQLGYVYVQFANITFTAATMFFAVQILRLLGYKNEWILIPFIIFSNINFVCINSGLTEPMFGFWLTFAAYLFIKERYIIGSIFVSFIPFVRAEGYIMLSLFLVILILRKQFKSIPLLGFAYILFSIIGSFVFKDVLWIKHQNPYNGDNINEYGKGALTFFIQKFDYVFGYTLGFLIIIGLLYSVIYWIKKWQLKTLTKPYFLETQFLLFAPFVLYFAAHSYFWWRGGYDSYGLVRVFAGVAVSGAFIAYFGLQQLLDSITDNTAKKIVTGSFIFFVICTPFVNPAYTLNGLRPELATVKQATDWAKKNVDTEHVKIYAQYPLVALELNCKTYNDKTYSYLWGLNDALLKDGTSIIPEGSLLFWDSGFAAREGKLPIETLSNNPSFTLLKMFHKPKGSIDTSDFKIYIFKKTSINADVKAEKKIENAKYSDTILKQRIEKIKQTPEWMDEVIKKATKRKITLDSMLYEDAVWSLDKDNESIKQ